MPYDCSRFTPSPRGPEYLRIGPGSRIACWTKRLILLAALRAEFAGSAPFKPRFSATSWPGIARRLGPWNHSAPLPFTTLLRLFRSVGLLAGLWAPTLADADVRLPAIFSDHAVLQRHERTAIWGRADSGEDVTITLGPLRKQVRAGMDGRWRVVCDLRTLSDGPHELVAEGKNRVTVRDVVVGDVWFCSGQSNMEWKLAGAAEAAAETVRPRDLRLRQFLVRRTAAAQPRDDCEGRWIVAAPETVGEFTAVGYFFGRTVVDRIGRPLGLINATWGGSPAEAWMSAEAIAADPKLGPSFDRQRRYEEDFPALVDRYNEAFDAWARRYDREDRRSAAAPPPAISNRAPATSLTLPGPIAGPELPAAGVFWLLRKVHVPDQPIAGGLERGFLVSVGTISGYDEVYWNGVKIGAMDPRIQGLANVRRYTVPSTLVEPGRDAELAIRLYDPSGPPRVDVTSEDLFAAGAEQLHGEWLVHVERAFPPLDPAARASRPQQPLRPRLQATRYFNGMIAPLTPYRVRGFLWYQGESNTGRAAQYRTTFPRLIADWRSRWGDETLPFYFCQLANHLSKTGRPAESAWAELREAQSSALNLPRTGQAVLIDLGEEKDIHPRRKQEAGERLARLALKRDYQQPVADTGPTFQHSVIERNRIRILFDGADGGLTARMLPPTYRPKSTEAIEVPLLLPVPDSEVQGFVICGADRRWHWARAKIEDTSILVWSEDVPTPVAVRYAWADNPTCNLYNGEGLPAAPFRTDDFPGITEAAKF